MNRIAEIVLVNACVATLLAFLAAAIGRWSRWPALAHWVWVLVLLKLVTPPLFTIGIPLPWSDVPPKKPVTVAQLPRFVSAAVPRLEAPGEAHPALAMAPIVRALAESPANPGTASVVEQAIGQKPLSWTMIAGWAWFAGAAGIVGIAGWRGWQFQRGLRLARGGTPELQAMIRRLAETLQVRPPAVYVLDDAVSPLIWAAFGRASLILPAELLRRLDTGQLEALLVHELAHIRRRDYCVRWLELSAMIACWWHPVTWWARRRIEELEEECCDAWVVTTLPQAARAYARALLTTVDYLSNARPALPPLASGLGYVNFLKRRLTMILRGPRDHRMSRPLWLAALGTALLILPFSAALLPSTRAADDDEETAAKSDPAPDSSTRELDRRLRSLESRMDRLLRTLERSSRAKGDGGDSSKPDSEETRKAKQQEADQERKAAERAKRQEADQARREADQARRQADQARRQAELAKRMAEAQRRMSEAREKIKSHADAGSELISKDLQKQIEQAVHEAIDPKRLEDMERQIESAVNKNLSPERMEAMGKQIEQAVNHAINPQKIEAMARQIEQMVNRNLQIEKLERAHREQSGTDKDKSSTTDKSFKSSTASARSHGRDRGDIEQRIQQLEEKLDRVLDAVEKSRKP